jgi:nicotinamidase-related amidase
MSDHLLPMPLTARSVHLYVDMQRLFSAGGPGLPHGWTRSCRSWGALASRYPERTVFTRFIPPERLEQMPGMWRRYYARWRVASRKILPVELLELMPPLAAGDNHRQDTLFRLRRTRANYPPTTPRGGHSARLGVRDRCLRAGDRARRG